MDMRPQRALQIATQGQVKHLGTETFEVKSQSGNGFYAVSKIGEDWKCECPDFAERRTTCKHIYAVSFAQSLKATLKAQVSPKPIVRVGLERPDSCLSCGSKAVVKRGF